jgi:hypothetical protein
MLGGRSRAAISARRLASRLRVEELEDRVVPSAIHSDTSTNWSGYAASTSAGAVTAVSGAWIVPTVTGTGSGTTYSSAWVGIDGFNSSTVEQTGTEMDVTNGKASYSAWYEIYPNAPVTIPINVHPGDAISASVTYNGGGKFTLKLSDSDGNQSYTTTQSLANPQLSSAEWIVEAPSSSRGVLPLANFGSVTFTTASATISNTNATINNSSAWAAATLNQINMESTQGTVEATTSGIIGSGFAVGFGSSAPTSPVSPPPAAPPPTPVPPPPVAPPAPAVTTTNVATVTSLTAAVDPFSRVPTVTFVATVKGTSGKALPTGLVEVMDGNTLLGTAEIQDINGVAEVVFTVTFPPTPGVYTISVLFPGSTGLQGSTSNTITVTVT